MANHILICGSIIFGQCGKLLGFHHGFHLHMFVFTDVESCHGSHNEMLNCLFSYVSSINYKIQVASVSLSDQSVVTTIFQ